MTNEIIATIRAEIERLKEGASIGLSEYDAGHENGVCETCNDLLSIISDLEKSLPAKVADGDGLNGEIERYFEGWSDDSEYGQAVMRNGACAGVDECKDIARHFYDLGCRRTAEKYDEIEYNRQRAEEPPVALVAIKPILPAALKSCIATFKEQGGSSEIPKDLEEAARQYFENPENSWEVRDVFIAGAKWSREQMMKDGLDAVKSGQSNKIEKTIAGVFVKYGMDRQKEKMMKEAVEYEVGMHGEPIKITIDKYVQRAKGIFPGDKVRVIIVKEDKK